jgi:hypothetical protein
MRILTSLRRTIAGPTALVVIFMTSVGHAQSIPDATVLGLLSQLTSADWTIRKNNFYALLNLGTAGAAGLPYVVPAELTYVLQNTSAGSAEQVRLALIALLTVENGTIAPAYDTSAVAQSVTEEYTDYYADVAAAVASLRDFRSISSLIGAMRSGDVATSALAAFGDAAVDTVSQQVSSSDELVQFSAIFTLEEMLDQSNFAGLSDSTKIKLRQMFARVAVQSGDSETALEAAKALGILNRLTGLVGDINGDGVVSCGDVTVVKRSFGKRTGQSDFDVRADVNFDGVVDVRDLAIVTQKLPAGTRCP